MFCSHCGSAIEDGAKFCPNCGEKIVPPVGSDITVPTPKIENPFEKATLTNDDPFEMKKDKASDTTEEVTGAAAAGAAAFGAASGSTGSPFKTESTYESHTYNTDSFSSNTGNDSGSKADSSKTGSYESNNGSYSGYQQYGRSSHYKGSAPITSRSIPLCIVFTIITCGIYGIYWLIVMVNDLNTATEEPNETSGGMVFLFSLITCGIYGLYWMYKAGTRLDNLKESLGRSRDSRGIVYLLLSIFGLNIVAYCLIQNELNKLADGTY